MGFHPKPLTRGFRKRVKETFGSIFKKFLISIQNSPENGFISVKVPCAKMKWKKSPSATPKPARDERLRHLEQENAELTQELRGALKDLRQLLAEKRELEEQLKATPTFSEHHRDNPRSATKGKTAPIAS